MNRDILFRGKVLSKTYGLLKRENGWVFGVPVPIKHNTYMTKRIEIVQCHGYDELDYYELLSEDEEVDPKTVGQFTGLLDKNGKKIFEDDILSIIRGDVMKGVMHPTHTEIGTVEYHTDRFLMKTGYEYKDISPLKYIEVIGNIHDNPELLEEV